MKHGDIKGFMPAMTMAFRVSDGREFVERKPGELIKATLVVTDSAGRLEDVVRTGEAPLPADAPKPMASSLEPGAEAPDATFVDQDGRTRRLSDWRGKTLAVTFVYTRCPLPDFCPLMDRNFAAVQRELSGDAQLSGRTHLLTVTFDPEYDTPDVLRVQAAKAGALRGLWTWLTGEREAIDSFASTLGVSVTRGDNRQQAIVHNLRTIVIDPDGRIVTILNGNDWKPEELLAALRAADAR